ncbi:MAG: hypothetical protein GF344_18310 [Chitinivibrionales bacterium]|nr:hypothetical protein [Chitinivibrionales bacterium]MBD3358612.1 hypothetical protein [Chitinivibrionales bacterium]
MRRKSARRLVAAAVILALLAFLHFVSLGKRNEFWSALQNYGHVPLFAVLTVSLFHFWRNTIQVPRTFLYPIAFGSAMILGLLSEIAQVTGPRDAELSDLLRDGLGSAGALALMFSHDRILKLSRTIRFLALLTGVVLLLAPLTRVIVAAVTLTHRNKNFPTICSFESLLEMRGLSVDNAYAERVPPPPRWKKASGRSVAAITFHNADDWPRFGWPNPYPDWRGSDTLTFEVWSDIDSSRPIFVRINDLDHNHASTDRFGRRIEITPGATTVSIPLQSVAQAPQGRTMRMDRIADLTVFAERNAEEFMLYFDNFRLE